MGTVGWAMDGELHLQVPEKGPGAEQRAEKLLDKQVGEARAIVGEVEELLYIREVREARAIAGKALAAGGSPVRRVFSLLAMADVEFADSDLLAAKARLTEAVDVSGQEPEARQICPEVVARQIRALRRNGLWRDALQAVKKIPDEICDKAEVRAEAGDFYRDCRCHAHAIKSYGSRHGLRHSARAARRWCWLRSGGPSAAIRQRIREWEEEKLLTGLRQRSPYIDLVDNVGLEDAQARQLRSQLETLNYRVHSHWYTWNAVERHGYRLMPAVIVPVWLVLLVVVQQAGFASGWGAAAAAAAVSAFIAASSVVLLVIVLIRPNLESRFQFRVSALALMVYFSFVVVFEVAAGEGFDRRVLSVGGWWSWVVLGLVVTPAAIACLLAAGMIDVWLWQRWFRKLNRENCLLVVLNTLLDVLDYLRPATGGRNISRRLYLAGGFEYAARCLTRDLLPSSTTGFLGARDWLIQRAEGWAEALRHMQRQMVASVPGDLTKLEEQLVHEIRCLATCDIGALAWCEPPPPVLRRRAITWARVILVAGLPLAAVLITQQFVHVPGVFSWAAGIWALLYVLLSIDPAIRDKIEAAHEIAGLLRTAPPPR
jgi:hypothetical protein